MEFKPAPAVALETENAQIAESATHDQFAESATTDQFAESETPEQNIKMVYTQQIKENDEKKIKIKELFDLLLKLREFIEVEKEEFNILISEQPLNYDKFSPKELKKIRNKKMIKSLFLGKKGLIKIINLLDELNNDLIYYFEEINNSGYPRILNKINMFMTFYEGDKKEVYHFINEVCLHFITNSFYLLHLCEGLKYWENKISNKNIKLLKKIHL